MAQTGGDASFVFKDRAFSGEELALGVVEIVSVIGRPRLGRFEATASVELAVVAARSRSANSSAALSPRSRHDGVLPQRISSRLKRYRGNCVFGRRRPQYQQ